MRQIGVFVALLLVLLQPAALAAPEEDHAVNLVAPSTRDAKIRTEADYILACQYLGTGSAYGAINNVYGAPTWVVPRENGTAILALLEATRVLGDSKYRIGAQRAADYLVKVQQQDGCWCDQYVYSAPTNLSKSPSQTAAVMMALFKLGYQADTVDPHDRFDAMKRGAECLMSFQNVQNKGGRDDGLLGGGKNADGDYRQWRWTHDNAYAYWALRMAASWASQGAEREFATRCSNSAQQIAEGLMDHLYNSATGIWHIAVDAGGMPQWVPGLDGLPIWVQYAPVMLDIPLGVDRERVGEWIHTSLQQDDGSCIEYTSGGDGPVMRKYPGKTLQAALVWLDTQQAIYAQTAMDWAETGGLWQTEPDDVGVTGGWVNWVEVSPNPDLMAEPWDRHIETSAYAITSWSGGYDFGMPQVQLPIVVRR